MWYSTELMIISQNKDKQQNQKVSLWTEPGALSRAHYLLSEKKVGEGLWQLPKSIQAKARQDIRTEYQDPLGL